MLAVPVVFFIYNRPEKTRQSFQAIRAVKPAILYIIADGPKSAAEDFDLVDQTRQIVADVDWDCQVRREYAPVNMNCGIRISSGLDWVFQECHEAIILEDDIVATPAFFDFCVEMLRRYQDDTHVMSVTGWNGIVEHQSTKYDAFLSQNNSIWGWATWRRAWATYLYEPAWEANELNVRLVTYFPESFRAKLYQHIYDHKIWRRYQTWDFQWSLAIFFHQGMIVTPSVNLCQNIGLDSEGTHLDSFNIRALFPVFELSSNTSLYVHETPDPDYDLKVLYLSLISSYEDIRPLLLAFKNPRLLPAQQSQLGWECSLQPFRESERCLQLLTHLERYVQHPEIRRYKSAFQKLIPEKV